MAASETLRLFFAVPLPEELREVVRGLQQTLSEACSSGPRVRWVEPENLHLTLKFIGDTAAEDVDRVVEIARQAAKECSPASVQVSGVGRFPPRGAPRVIWVGLSEECTELTELAGRLDRALQAEGVAEPERHPFTAHFTIGRVKGHGRAVALSETIERMSEEPVGKMRIDEFCLISSDLTPHGPIYTERTRFNLA